MDRFSQSFIVRQVRTRPLACFAAAFLIGVIAGWYVHPPVWICAVSISASLVLAACLHHTGKSTAAAILLLALAAGGGRMVLSLSAVPVWNETVYSAQMTGRIISEPWKNPTSGRVISKFRLQSVNGEASDTAVRLYLRGDDALLENVRYGQQLQLKGHIWKCDPITNPYEFDFGQYLARDGMSAYATAKVEDVTVLGETADFNTLLIQARTGIGKRIDALFPKSSGMVRALLLGDRSMLGDEMRSALSKTGTAHLISISGLHVTVLAMLLSLAFRPFTSRAKAGLLALLPLIIYGALIGFRAPYARALIMFAIYSFAPLCGSPSDPVTRLSAAMLIWLIIDPMDILDAGFVLSYGACAGLILLTSPLSRLMCVDRLIRGGRKRSFPLKAAGYFATLVLSSLAAQLATLPAIIASFGVQPLASIPFNLVCVPLCMIGYVLALAAVLLSALIPPFSAFAAQLPDALLHLLMQITQLVEGLPVASVRIGRYPAILIVLHCVLIPAASDLCRTSVRIRRFIPISLIGVALTSSFLVYVNAWPFSVTFLDADQADCAIVRTRGRTYMVDAGDTYTPAEDYLSATCLHLDGVILSHPHQDHVGGLLDILSMFRPDVIYVPLGWHDAEITSEAVRAVLDQIDALGIPVVELASGDRIDLSKDVVLSVYSPLKGKPPASVNDLSMLALIASGEHGILFTGDLSSEGEPDLVPDADVLKVAHHGSDKATSQRFIDACTPEFAIISVGENNFGHPSADTLDRLSQSGATVCQTRQCGAITLTLKADQWHLDTYLEVNP